MPKKNQIQGYAAQKLTGGRTGHYWRPSPRERREGWSTITFGEGDAGRRAALIGCLARNDEVEAARLSAHPEPVEGRAAHPEPAERRRGPARPRWRDLVARYKADARYRDLKPKSRAEYDSRIRTLDHWALDGDLTLAELDRVMVIDLRDALVNGDGRRYRTAGLLRVLSVVLGFGADRGMLPLGIGQSLDIPSPPRRRRRLRRDQVAPLVAAADALGYAHIRLGIVLGFYSMQRQGDLLAATAFQIRPVEDLSADARRALAGPDGHVMGLWLQQEKTATWVAISLPPIARIEVEAAIAAGRARGAACTNLILYPGEDRPCPDWRFQRDFRAVVAHAVAQAMLSLDGDLAALLTGIQFRDLRRSGMCWHRELRVPATLIASNSGHSIRETEDILETYMPRDTRAAAEGMAIAVARQAERDAETALEQEEAK